jgi:hypothetical protein
LTDHERREAKEAAKAAELERVKREQREFLEREKAKVSSTQNIVQIFLSFTLVGGPFEKGFDGSYLKLDSFV